MLECPALIRSLYSIKWRYCGRKSLTYQRWSETDLFQCYRACYLVIEYARALVHLQLRSRSYWWEWNHPSYGLGGGMRCREDSLLLREMGEQKRSVGIAAYSLSRTIETEEYDLRYNRPTRILHITLKHCNKGLVKRVELKMRERT